MFSFRQIVPVFAIAIGLGFVTGCGAHVSSPQASIGSEWIAADKVDLRHVTAIVRANPPARLKATFEAAAAHTDDEDLGSFLRAAGSGGLGSGFLMLHRNADDVAAFVVTNRHVIAEADEAEVSFGDGTTYKNCKITFSSPKHDLAVIALPESAKRALGGGLRPATNAATDRLPVIATGYPVVGGAPSYQITDGKVSNARFDLSGASVVQHTAPIDPGSSGGPLTDEAGALVGVNVALIQGRASMFFAVPTSAVVDTVREAHALTVNTRSATWMTAELEKTCARFSAELESASIESQRLGGYVSSTLIAERGFESFLLLTETSAAPQIRRAFYQAPLITLRYSVLSRIAYETKRSGGATGTCKAIHAGDAASISDGKRVRASINTKEGAVELAWTFEHGSWRIAGADLSRLERRQSSSNESPSAPPPAPSSGPKKPGVASAKKGAH